MRTQNLPRHHLDIHRPIGATTTATRHGRTRGLPEPVLALQQPSASAALFMGYCRARFARGRTLRAGRASPSSHSCTVQRRGRCCNVVMHWALPRACWHAWRGSMLACTCSCKCWMRAADAGRCTCTQAPRQPRSSSTGARLKAHLIARSLAGEVDRHTSIAHGQGRSSASGGPRGDLSTGRRCVGLGAVRTRARRRPAALAARRQAVEERQRARVKVLLLLLRLSTGAHLSCVAIHPLSPASSADFPLEFVNF